MKIALIRKEYTESRGGAERYAVCLGSGLERLGHEVHVFTGLWDTECDSNITFHKVPFIRNPSPLKNLSFQRNARNLLKKDNFDIIHGLSQVYPQDIYRVGDGLHRHWMQIQIPDNFKGIFKYLNPRHQVILAIEKQIFKNGHYHRIIANSSLCKQQIQHYYGVPEKKIELIYNGIDLNTFNLLVRRKFRQAVRRRSGFKDEETVLLFVGHNFKRKGLQSALQCAILVKARGYNIKLVIAGRGNPRPFIKTAADHGFTEDLVFLGQIKNIETIYGASDILIHPALYDPCSNVCLEAMACGLPAVTTRMNGVSEIIEDGQSGLVLEHPWEIAKMADGIESLLENQGAKLQLMGQRAACAAEQYPIEKNIQKTIEVYRDVLHEKGLA